MSFEAFGLAVACAIVFGTVVGIRRFHAVGLDTRVAVHLALWMVAGGMVGAHLVSALFYFPGKIAADPLYLLRVWEDISSVGGFIGGSLSAVVFLRRYRIPVWAYGDGAVYGFAFGWIFGRLGCTLAFDHPGIVTDFPLGMAYPHALDGEPAGVVRHNLGLYEMLWQLVLFAVLFSQRRAAHVSGYYVATALLLYMPVRFALDFLRVGDATYGGLTAAQYATVGLFIVGLWLLSWRCRVGERVVADGRIHVFADGRPAIADADGDAVPPLRWV